MAHILVNKSQEASIIKNIEVPGAQPYGIVSGLNKQGDKLVVCGAYRSGNDYLAGVYIQSWNTADLQGGKVFKTEFTKDLVEIPEKEGWASPKGKKYGVHGAINFEANILKNDVVNFFAFDFRNFAACLRQKHSKNFIATRSNTYRPACSRI